MEAPNGAAVSVGVVPQPWKVVRISQCQIAVGSSEGNPLLLVLLLPDGTGIEVPVGRGAAERIGKALLAPHLHMP